MVKSTMTATFPYPIAEVWRKVTDLSNQDWRGGLTKFEKVDDSHFIEHSKDGIQTNFIITKSLPQKIWQLEFHNQNIRGTWIGEFSAQDGQTSLRFTENVQVKNRFLSPLVWLYLKTQQRQYYRDLMKALRR